jgi:drug/metabolite transporter (DMT)-like permease
VAVLLGAFFADETLTVRTAVAGAIIIGSVVVVITAHQVNQKVALLSRPQLHNRSETG